MEATELVDPGPFEKRGQELVKRVLNLGVNGLGPVKGAIEVAEEHRRHYGSTEQAVEKLTVTHSRLVGATGFAAGLGGWLAAAVAIPSDMAVLYVYEGRLAAATAHLRGYDVGSEEVRSVVMLSLLGAAGTEIAADFGIKLGQKAAFQLLQQVPGKVFIEINKKVGFRLITKAGEKGLVNMTKLLPVVGGGVGATINVASMRMVGRYARKNFPPRRPGATVPLHQDG